MQERRKEKRELYNYEGFFVLNGSLREIKIRDTGSSGVGVYASHELKPGQQGVLFAKMPGSDRINEFHSVVLWCHPDPGSSDDLYPFRVGLMMIGDN